MKIITSLIIFFSIFSFSQIITPVKWDTSIEKKSKNEYDIVFTAEVDDGWHLYSQHLSEGGPLPTVFKFIPSTNYKCEGKPSEEKGKEVYEEVFEMNVKYFENKAVFKQRIKTNTNKPLKIEGEISYMSCNTEKCIPGYTNFEISTK
ncbi:protein-disulfide reductase DsbD domain-containing protein [Algibacter aquimarinus]|uniref:Thiol:disulfide interchange protein DsbD N-terminal domain-containing protein n=1 Tax=Algibacter aquimarinus TaxID=1136748 RepID=A0ABP9H2T6_9FLAO